MAVCGFRSPWPLRHVDVFQRRKTLFSTLLLELSDHFSSIVWGQHGAQARTEQRANRFADAPSNPPAPPLHEEVKKQQSIKAR
jgi:hypothetical protein